MLPAHFFLGIGCMLMHFFHPLGLTSPTNANTGYSVITIYYLEVDLDGPL